MARETRDRRPMRDESDSWWIAATAVVFEVSLGVFAVLIGWIFGIQPLKTFRWDWEATWWGLAAVGPMMLLFFALTHIPLRPFRRIGEILDETLLPYMRSLNLYDLAAISLAAGVGEEVLFRGLIQQGLGDLFGVGVGLLAASAVFGFAHPITPTYVVITTVVGLYLGGLWLWTGNLLAPSLAHAVYDFFALVYMLRFEPSASDDGS